MESIKNNIDDNLSIKSSDSVTTSGEYEIVPELPDSNNENLNKNNDEIIANSINDKPAKSPTLNIANNGDMDDLEKNLNEVIHEMDASPNDTLKGG